MKINFEGGNIPPFLLNQKTAAKSRIKFLALL
jgi:hypothetical protein